MNWMRMINECPKFGSEFQRIQWEWLMSAGENLDLSVKCSMRITHECRNEFGTEYLKINRWLFWVPNSKELSLGDNFYEQF